jgi:hypothetical protein
MCPGFYLSQLEFLFQARFTIWLADGILTVSLFLVRLARFTIWLADEKLDFTFSDHRAAACAHKL